jgi:hypothetical protein
LSTTINGGFGNAAGTNTPPVVAVIPLFGANDGATVSGGILNTATSLASTVGGGCENKSIGCFSIVGGGYKNTTLCDYSIVVGGCCNTSCGCCSIIGGGFSNLITTNLSGILGGCGNIINNAESFIVGNGITSTADNTLHANCLNLKNMPTQASIGSLPSGSLYYDTGDGNTVKYKP